MHGKSEKNVAGKLGSIEVEAALAVLREAKPGLKVVECRYNPSEMYRPFESFFLDLPDVGGVFDLHAT